MKRLRWLPRFRRSQSECPECGAVVPETHCEVCGYELVRESRADVARYKPPA
jgi:predicted amidophosphoribosyltransferase